MNGHILTEKGAESCLSCQVTLGSIRFSPQILIRSFLTHPHIKSKVFDFMKAGMYFMGYVRASGKVNLIFNGS